MTNSKKKCLTLLGKSARVNEAFYLSSCWPLILGAQGHNGLILFFTETSLQIIQCQPSPEPVHKNPNHGHNSLTFCSPQTWFYSFCQAVILFTNNAFILTCWLSRCLYLFLLLYIYFLDMPPMNLSGLTL